MRLFAECIALYSCFLSWFWVCVLYSSYDVRKRRRRRSSRALFQGPVHSKARNPRSFKASHPDACYYTYHYLSCIFLLLKFYKNCLNKTIFDVAITTIMIILTFTLPLVKLGVTKPVASIWYLYHLKIINMKSLSGHPKNWLLKNKGFKKNPGGKVGLCPREEMWRWSFLEKCFQKWNIT